MVLDYALNNIIGLSFPTEQGERRIPFLSASPGREKEFSSPRLDLSTTLEMTEKEGEP
jgi:hypothetical protein